MKLKEDGNPDWDDLLKIKHANKQNPWKHDRPSGQVSHQISDEDMKTLEDNIQAIVDDLERKAIERKRELEIRKEIRAKINKDYEPKDTPWWFYALLMFTALLIAGGQNGWW